MVSTSDLPQPLTPARRRTQAVALIVALAAGGVLLATPPAQPPTAAAGRAPATTAWPRAQRADIPGNLPDGPAYQPGIFLDARTSVGTAPSPDGRFSRLLVRSGDGTLRELRRLPIADSPDFYNLTARGDHLAWTESTDSAGMRLWAANLRTGDPPRLLTADTGEAIFYGTEHDLLIEGDRLYWLAAGASGDEVTEVRSVALAGGPVEVRRQTGTWSLTAWPWLVTAPDDQTSATVLRDHTTNREVAVKTGASELTTCDAAWCRIMVMSPGGGLVGIDAMHPDGTARQRIAGPGASAAITDVAVLGRYAILSEEEPASSLNGGGQRLLVYDLAARRTIDVAGAVTAAFSRNGVLWWSTGNQDNTAWHAIDLRTI